MRIVMQVFVGVLLFGGFLAAPTLLIWGWVRWMRRPGGRDNSTILSFVGFLFATASALLAVSAMAYAYSIRGFPYYDPRLLKIYLGGLGLSLVGITLSALGTARPNLLRWHALGSSTGMLLLWIVAMESE
jgi:hypothetical protein